MIKHSPMLFHIHRSRCRKEHSKVTVSILLCALFDVLMMLWPDISLAHRPSHVICVCGATHIPRQIQQHFRICMSTSWQDSLISNLYVLWLRPLGRDAAYTARISASSIVLFTEQCSAAIGHGSLYIFAKLYHHSGTKSSWKFRVLLAVTAVSLSRCVTLCFTSVAGARPSRSLLLNLVINSRQLRQRLRRMTNFHYWSLHCHRH